MKMMTRTLVGFVVFVLLTFWVLFFSPRPANTTDPATLAGDGSVINYCELPVLDGRGMARQIFPRATRQDAATHISRYRYWLNVPSP